ncbi:hypothetical protein GCM10022631_26020 [Deinococcus rubellus]
MPVVWIRQAQGFDQRLVVSDEGVVHGLIHQGAGALEAGRVQVRAVRQQVANPLIVNGVGPAGLVDLENAEIDQQTPQGRRVQDIVDLS